ncbi:tyrosine-type recombinase/integrase [Clostridium tertium]
MTHILDLPTDIFNVYPATVKFKTYQIRWEIGDIYVSGDARKTEDNPLPHITPHTLCRTFCTRLASKNMKAKDLQYIMGHSNISITMNWYAHASIDTAKSEVQHIIV